MGIEKKRFNKKAQFFIIAAVILSVIIVGLVAVKNSVVVKKEPSRFYDLSYELNKETSKIIDYGVYQGVDINDKMKEFTESVATNIKDSDPSVGFVFIYGNQTELIIENYGNNTAYFQVGNDAGSVDGASSVAESKIRLSFGGSLVEENVEGELKDYKQSWRTTVDSASGSSVVVRVSEQDYNFNVGKDQKFFMIIKKISGEENYVNIR